MIVLISQAEAKKSSLSEGWLLKTKHLIESVANTIGYGNRNFNFDNNDMKHENRKTRDTTFIETEVKEYNELLKPDDAHYVDFRKSSVLNRDVFGVKSKQKTSFISEKKAAPMFNTVDEYDGSGDDTTTVGM